MKGRRTRNAAPGLAEIALLQVLHVRRRRRVIGPDRFDAAVRDKLPQPLLVRARPQRRRAFVFGRALGDVLRREKEVVRAGLHAYGQPCGQTFCTSQCHALQPARNGGAYLYSVAPSGMSEDEYRGGCWGAAMTNSTLHPHRYLKALTLPHRDPYTKGFPKP